MTETNHNDFTRRVLRDMSTAVVVLNTKGHVLYVNHPASEMLELPAEFSEKEIRFPEISDNNYNDEFNEYIFNALYQKENTHIGHVRYMTPSGRKYVFRMSSSFLEGEGASSRIVITLADETEAEKMRQRLVDSSTTFTTFLFGFCGWMIFYALWEYLKRPFSADYLTHGIEVLGLLMLGFILRYTSLSWRDLGIHADDPKKTLKSALIAAGCSVLFLCALKLGIRIFRPQAFRPDLPFLDLRLFGLRQILYVFTAGIQEFLARSVMQGNLKRIMVSRHNGAMSILLSSLVFAALHIHLGFLFMMGAAVLAGLEGILYEKHKTIYGVWVVHWVFGVAGTLLSLIDH